MQGRRKLDKVKIPRENPEVNAFGIKLFLLLEKEKLNAGGI